MIATNQNVNLIGTSQILNELGLKRPDLMKYVTMGILKPLKKRGPQPENYRGRKFLYKPEAVEKLRVFLKEHNNPTAAAVPIKRSKQDILNQLDMAMRKVDRLEKAVKMLEKSMIEAESK